MGYWKSVDIFISVARDRIKELNEDSSNYNEEVEKIIIECSKEADLNKKEFENHVYGDY